MSTRKVDVLILGGGIIGTWIGWDLQQRGREVVIIDKAPPGHGSSFGNAGWLTPCFATPLPKPGMLIPALKWMMDPESPLYIKPQFSMTLAKWLMGFLSSMTEEKFRRSVEVLSKLSFETMEKYKGLNARNPDAFGFRQDGLLLVSETEESLAGSRKQTKLMQEFGVAAREMSADELVAFEPSIRRDKTVGAIFYPDEAHVEPYQTVTTTWNEFTEKGGETVSTAEAYDFEIDGHRIVKVRTTHGDFEPELVVWALGSWSEELGKRLKIHIPVFGGKGYAVIVDDSQLQGENCVKPLRPIKNADRNIAITPREDSLRLAGTLELIRNDFSITPRRIGAILRGAKEFLRIPRDFEVREVWRGLRPCTPDGLPMIGFSEQWSNLFYATGHQMLGLHTSAGTGRLAAELIEGVDPFVNPTPFDPTRYRV